MKFSIVTAAYRAAATIEDTLRSVREQDWPQVEHLIVDGGSPDDTAAIARAYVRPGGLVSSEPDHGLYDAMNKGIARATGDVVAILNADDFYVDAYVLSQVATVFREQRVDAVLTDVAFLNNRDPGRIGRRYNSGRFTPGRIGWGWMPAHPGMFLTSDAYCRVGEYALDYRIAADFEFIARAFGRHRLSYAYLPIISVMMRPGGVSTAGLRSTVTIATESVRACRTNGIRSNLLMIASKYPLKLLEHWR
ncbi:MAG: glycosyltransferase family 2 protein [Pseudomonadota bacterium]